MHLSSLENLRLCLKKHVIPDPVLSSRGKLNVLDVGSADVNGGYRSIFALLECEYTGVDLGGGPGVDLVLDDPYHLPFPDNNFDIVFSGQTFEHSEFYWKLFAEMCRVAKDEAVIIVIAPSAGPVHRFPVDCYRMMPDAVHAMAKFAGVTLMETWTSDFGPWHDNIGIFRKVVSDEKLWSLPPDLTLRLATPVQNTFPPNVPEEVEHGAGTEDRYELLARAHEILEPRFYSEIGVAYGSSLRLAKCPALGIDPAPELSAPLDPIHKLSLTTSDDFYWLTDAASQMQPIDFSYIDGMHQIEFALRDFMYTERFCHQGSVVIIDDIYPAHALQGERIRQSRFWTGDIWKMIAILEGARPDLILMPLNTSPTGSLLVLGLDPTNNELWEKFDVLVDWAINKMTTTPDEIVYRTRSFEPLDPIVTRVLHMIRRGRENGTEVSTLESIRELIAGSLPRVVVSA